MVQLTDAPSLYPEIEERTTPPGRGQHSYYRRKSDGKIVTAPAWAGFRQDMEFKGFEILPEFGVFTFGTPWGDTNKDRSGRDFNAIAEPWRLIFQHPNGAVAFPSWQVIAYRWHIRPPYREVHFPQLDDVEVFDLFCPECDKGIFSSVSQGEAVEMLRVHLTTTTNTAHSYRPEDLRALGTEYEIDFFAPRRARRSVRDKAVLNDVEPEELEVAELSPTAAYVCKDCGAEFNDKTARMQHGRVCPAKSQAGV